MLSPLVVCTKRACMAALATDSLVVTRGTAWLWDYSLIILTLCVSSWPLPLVPTCVDVMVVALNCMLLLLFYAPLVRIR